MAAKQYREVTTEHIFLGKNENDPLKEIDEINKMIHAASNVVIVCLKIQKESFDLCEKLSHIKPVATTEYDTRVLDQMLEIMLSISTEIVTPIHPCIKILLLSLG